MKRHGLVLIAMFCCGSFHCAPLRAVSLEWVRQLGSTAQESNSGVSVDSMGNVYISGSTRGNLGGPIAGTWDAFVSKYDTGGNLAWTRQLGTSSSDGSSGVSVDGLGNVYISGTTGGDLGGTYAGLGDAFVSKYDTAGNLLWTQQLGTAAAEESYGVSADGLGNVFISGYTAGTLGASSAGGWDAFVSKYDTAGNLIWTQQLGTSNDEYSECVGADGLGNVYISGVSYGGLGGGAPNTFDTFVAKYDGAGNLLWTERLGLPSFDEALSISADRLGNVFISGKSYDTSGPNAGNMDAFVGKFDATGNLLWTRRLSSSTAYAMDIGYGVSADGLGNVYLTGNTEGDLVGTNAGSTDAFLSKYDGAGNLLWTEQFGTTDGDAGSGVFADGLGNVYVSGSTGGNLGGTFAGGTDVFVAKFADPVPEPSTAMLWGILAVVGLMLRKRR